MKRHQDAVYVLRTHELGDADLIVTLLAEHHGKVRAVARSARRSRRRFGGALEPLTRARATWQEKQGRELHRLDALDAVRSFAEMQADPLRQAACAVLAEVGEVFAHEGQADVQGFRLLGAVLEALERGGPARILLRYFEFWMLRGHGLLPELDHCTSCGRPVPASGPARVSRAGQVLCDGCPRSGNGPEARLGRDDRAFFDLLRRRAPGELPRRAPAARPGGAVETLLRGTLESFAERGFRTYRHLSAAESLPGQGGTA